MPGIFQVSVSAWVAMGGALVSIASTAFVIWISHRRRLRAEARYAEAEQWWERSLTAVADATSLLGSVESNLAERDLKIVELEAALEIVKRQRTSYRELIEEVQHERDRWRELYYSQGTGHDNAQRWMMREIESLGQQLTAADLKPTISHTLNSVRDAFVGEHGQHLADYAAGRARQTAVQTTQRENETVNALDLRAGEQE